MGTKLRQLRVDDEVWDAVQALRKTFGTVNAGLRMKFRLGEPPDLRRQETSAVPEAQSEAEEPPITNGKACSDAERELVYEMGDV